MKRAGPLAAFALLVFAFMMYVAFPLAMMAGDSLKAGGGFSFQQYASLFDPANGANSEAILNSIFVAVLSVVFSGLLGLCLAFVVTQVEFPGKAVVARLAILPIALPPLVGVIAFRFVFGSSGLLPRILQGILHTTNPVLALEGIPGVVLVHVYSFHVYTYLFCAAALRNVDGALFDAAAGLGSRGWRTFRKVILPELRPALVASAALTCMSSMASFTAPLLFAGEKRFLTLQIFQTKLNGDINLAAAQSVLLTFVSLGLYAVMMSVGGTPQTARGGKGVARRGVLPVSPILRRLLVGGTFLLLLAELLPVAMIVLLSFVREGSWTTQLLPDRYVAQNYVSLLGERKMLEPLLNSLLCAGIAVIGSILFGVSAAVFASRARGRFWGRAANIILTLPYAVPGTVVAIALIVSFNVPRWFTGGMGLVGTFWILPFAYIMREYPVVVRSVTASLETMDGSLLDAADGLGASAWKRFRSVLVPAIAPAILSGAVLVAIASLGEFVSSIMLYTYASRPVSVEILAQLRQFNIGAASAYAVCLMLLILLILWIPSFLGRGGSGRENVTAMMDSSF